MIDGYVAGYDAWNECHPDNPEYKNEAMSENKKATPSLPADKPVTLPYVKATDKLPEDGQQVFFRLKRPNQPVKYLAGFFKKDNRPDKTNGGDLSGFTDDRNLYALSININYIEWVDEFPSLPSTPVFDYSEEVDRVRDLIIRASPYIQDMQSDNIHDPNVGIRMDHELAKLDEEIRCYLAVLNSRNKTVPSLPVEPEKVISQVTFCEFKKRLEFQIKILPTWDDGSEYTHGKITAYKECINWLEEIQQPQPQAFPIEEGADLKRIAKEYKKEYEDKNK